MRLCGPIKPIVIVLCFLVATTTLPVPFVGAAEHVVSRVDLDKAVMAASEERTRNVEIVQSYIHSLPSDAFSTIGGSQKIGKALAFLSDAELARLIEQASELPKDPTGAGLSNGQIWLIVIGGSVALLLLTVWAYNKADEFYN